MLCSTPSCSFAADLRRSGYSGVLDNIQYHGSTLVLACCKANHWSHGKKVIFVQPQSAHPSTDSNSNLHWSLSKSDQQLCQFWWRSHHWGLRYTGVKYNTFVCFYSIFSSPFLSFFILAIAYSLNAWTDFHGWWLKMRELVQGSAFCMFELCQTNFGGWYTLKTTWK